MPQKEAVSAPLPDAHALAEATSDGVVVLAENGAFAYVNAPAARLFGNLREDLVGRYPASPLEATGAWQTPSGLWVSVRSLGERTWLLTHARSLRACEHAAIPDERLMGRLAHDLRNPLNVIVVAAAGLVRHGDQDDRTRRAVVRIQSGAQRAVRLVNDLLDFTRVRLGGEIFLARVRLDMRVVATHALAGLRAAFPDRDVEMHAAGDTHGTWDSDRMAQIVECLTTNALRHSDGATPVRVTLRDDGGWLTIAVNHAGPPIPPERLGDLFEPFSARLRDTDATYANAGNGLELCIVQSIARAHGGMVRASSSAEAGTTLEVRVPRAPSCPESEVR